MAIDPISHESQVYADAIMKALSVATREISKPDMGAAMGALVTVLAHFIGGIEDHRYRKSTHRDVEKMLARQIARQIKEGGTAHTQVTVRGDPEPAP